LWYYELNFGMTLFSNIKLAYRSGKCLRADWKVRKATKNT